MISKSLQHQTLHLSFFDNHYNPSFAAEIMMMSRLEGHVSQMRAQTMTFNNDGVEVRFVHLSSNYCIENLLVTNSNTSLSLAVMLKHG